MLPDPVTLLRRTTCPHCWAAFAPEEVLWISAHSDLLGDPRLGPEQAQRFLPTRFNLAGNALDAKGFVCHRLACPQCHLPIPRALLEVEPFFVSILGTPACGKSYFLAAMTWELRRLLPLHFGLSFADADTVSNRSLNDYEESLFLNPAPDELVPLVNLIRKTELQGELYNTVQFGGQAISYPRPFLFSLGLADNHPHHAGGQRLACLLTLYDNAGEHFQPGQDSTGNAATQHLAQSQLLLFLFDPTQDQRFARLCPGDNLGAIGGLRGRTIRQESVLLEAAARVRRYTGLPEHARHNRPLTVVVTKWDVWADLLPEADAREPWVEKGGSAGLDRDRIERASRGLRGLLLQAAPEVVTAAENFAETVTYLPASALGRRPLLDPRSRTPAVRPRDVCPVWVTVPLLHGLSGARVGLVGRYKRKNGTGSAARSRPPASQGFNGWEVRPVPEGGSP